MPDLPDDTVIVNIPIDAASLPQYVIIRFTQARHNFKPRTNQEVINLFHRVFDGTYIEVITRAGLSGMFAKRKAVYEGEDVEGLPLGDDEKKRIIEAIWI